MRRLGKLRIAALAACCVLLTSVTAVGASDAVRLLVNGNELQAAIPAAIQDGTTVAPVRDIAEALGADVRWDDKERAVRITAHSKTDVTKEQVISWIKAQGRDQTDSYYWDGLSFRTANLDKDSELEVVAVIDGAVHIGSWFLFDIQSDDSYRLLAETDWKAESLNLEPINDIGSKKVFEVVERTGGTGIDIQIAHLYYLEQGKLIEAWQGVLQETSAYMNQYKSVMGGYRIDAYNARLYAWETHSQLEEDMVTAKGERQTKLSIHTFDGIKFVPEQPKS